MADDLGLDLVEISAKADPPVCKIIDYQKYLYQQKKKAKEMKSNSAKIVIKEIRFGPNTDEHDFQFKLKHAVEFFCLFQGPFNPLFRPGREASPQICSGTGRIRKGGADAETGRQADDNDDCTCKEKVVQVIG